MYKCTLTPAHPTINLEPTNGEIFNTFQCVVGDETDIDNCTLQNGKYLCEDQLKCIDFKYACDDRCNCLDCSDESTQCFKFGKKKLYLFSKWIRDEIGRNELRIYSNLCR